MRRWRRIRGPITTALAIAAFFPGQAQKDEAGAEKTLETSGRQLSTIRRTGTQIDGRGARPPRACAIWTEIWLGRLLFLQRRQGQRRRTPPSSAASASQEGLLSAMRRQAAGAWRHRLSRHPKANAESRQENHSLAQIAAGQPSRVANIMRRLAEAALQLWHVSAKPKPLARLAMTEGRRLRTRPKPPMVLAHVADRGRQI